MGFTLHFYIVFGTNLLTGGPAQIDVFLPISVFRRKGILDGVKTERNQLEKLFLERKPPDGVGPHVKEGMRCSRGWGRPPRRAPCLVASSMLPWLAHQVPGIASVPKITLPKVSFRLDFV